MARFVKTILLALFIIGGIWALANKDRIEKPADVVALVQEKLAAIPVGSFGSPGQSPNPVQLPDAQQIKKMPVVRLASFKLTGYGTSVEHVDQLPLVMDICRRYDAIALQGIDGRSDQWLRLLTSSLNSSGHASNGRADYDFISDRGENRQPTQSVILFNRKTVELDQRNWYTVNDPDNLLTREPLVGWFRTRTPNLTEAFTFTLVNIELSSVRPDLELAYLDELFLAIRTDGRGEDDVIIAGDFNAGDRGLKSVDPRSGLIWVVSNTPTDIRNQNQYDNLVFSESATVEFTGQGGVFDFMRKYNLRLNDAAAISERLPVWAEFSVFEGRHRVASRVD